MRRRVNKLFAMIRAKTGNLWNQYEILSIIVTKKCNDTSKYTESCRSVIMGILEQKTVFIKRKSQWSG